MLFKLRNILGKKKWMLIFFIIFIVVEALMVYSLRDINTLEFLELQITMSKDKFLEIINSWNENQIKAYHKHFFFDFIYLSIYPLFLFSIISYFFNRAHVVNKGSFFLILPFIVAFFDFIENMLHLNFIWTDYSQARVYFMVSGIFSIQKWVLAFVSLYIIVVLFLRLTILHKK